MNQATVVNGRTVANSDGYEVTQTEYRLDPPYQGCDTVVLSHVDPADGCDPSGVFLGETLDGGASLSYEEWKVYTGRRTYYRATMTDDQMLQKLGYMVSPF